MLLRCREKANKGLEKKTSKSMVIYFVALVVRKAESAIHRVNLYPLDSAIGSPNIYPLDSDLSGG